MPLSPNVIAVQQHLGVELPDSYIAAVETGQITTVDAYTFYALDELCWLSDHPLGDTIPYEGRALVIGEDVGGNAVVLLGFNVAGKPALSDEVYLIDHEVGEPEELAMDLVELLQEVGGNSPIAAETLWETAFEVSTARATAIAALNDVVEARGYSRATDAWDGEGSYLRVTVYGDGPVLIWVHTDEASLWLGRRLATKLDQSIKAFEVVLRDEVARDDNDEQGFPFKARRLDVLADGTMVDRETRIEAEVMNAGDPYETAESVMWELIDRPDGGDAEVFEFFCAARPATISPRLAALLTAIGESNGVELTEIAGQQAVRIELPDGTRQFSVVSDTELAVLREHVDL